MNDGRRAAVEPPRVLLEDRRIVRDHVTLTCYVGRGVERIESDCVSLRPDSRRSWRAQAASIYLRAP
jgi:hypothetical protein